MSYCVCLVTPNAQHADTSCFPLLLLFDFMDTAGIVGGNLFCSQNSKMITWITKRHRSQHSEYLNFQFQIPGRRLLTDCSFQTSAELLIIFLLVTDEGLSHRNTSKWTQLLLARVMVRQLGATPWGPSSCPLSAGIIHLQPLYIAAFVQFSLCYFKLCLRSACDSTISQSETLWYDNLCIGFPVSSFGGSVIWKSKAEWASLSCWASCLLFCLLFFYTFVLFFYSHHRNTHFAGVSLHIFISILMIYFAISIPRFQLGWNRSGYDHWLSGKFKNANCGYVPAFCSV